MKTDLHSCRTIPAGPLARSAVIALATLLFAQVASAIDASGGPALVNCGVLQRGRTNLFVAQFVLASNNFDQALIRPMADLEGPDDPFSDSDFFISLDPAERVVHYEWPDTTNGLRLEPVNVHLRPLGGEGATGPGDARLLFNVCPIAPGGGIGVGAGVRLSILYHVLAENASLVLGEIPGREVNEGEELAFPVPLEITNIPADMIEFQIAGAQGATIDATNWVFRWSPGERYGPGTNTVTITAGVRNDSFALFSVTNRFGVVIHEVNNHAPVLEPIPPQTVAEGATLVWANRATDGDEPSHLTFCLVAGPPTTQLDAKTGLLTWNTTETDGPGTNTFVISVADDGTPSLSATQSFEVVVREINQPPVLFPFPTQVFPGGRAWMIELLANSHHGAVWETYATIGSPMVGALTNDPHYPDLPSHVRFVTDWLEAPLRPGATYGQRLRAFVLPPATGEYVLWVASMQDSVLFLSTDAEPAHRLPVASVTGWVLPRTWDGQTNQQSAPIWLEANQVYYLEALMGEVTGDWASLAIRWRLPDGTIEEPIPAHRLWIPTPAAFDLDLPTNNLTFHLDAAPAGMDLNPISGLLTWTPNRDQFPSTNAVMVRVMDDGVPSLSATQTFNVVVRSAVPPQITGLQLLSTGAFRLQLSSEAGYPCVIEGSTNLLDWLPLATNLADASGRMEFGEPAANQRPQRFYRARQE